MPKIETPEEFNVLIEAIIDAGEKSLYDLTLPYREEAVKRLRAGNLEGHDSMYEISHLMFNGGMAFEKGIIKQIIAVRDEQYLALLKQYREGIEAAKGANEIAQDTLSPDSCDDQARYQIGYAYGKINDVLTMLN